MKLYGIVGTGGFGREVIPLADSILKQGHQGYELVFVTEDPSTLPIINNYKVMSLKEFLAEQNSEKYFNVAIANYEVRKRIAELLLQSGIKSFSIAASNHVAIGENQIDEGAIFCPFTTITSNAKIGKFFHANIYSYVAHDCIIGNYVTFAPQVCCNGGVIIEDDVYVGTGVIIKQSTPQKPIVIGQGAVLGMGAVVTKSVAPYTTVIGNPAKLLIKEIN